MDACSTRPVEPRPCIYTKLVRYHYVYAIDATLSCLKLPCSLSFFDIFYTLISLGFSLCFCIVAFLLPSLYCSHCSRGHEIPAPLPPLVSFYLSFWTSTASPTNSRP